MMNVDALFEAVEQKGPVCVGLDTSLDYIPPGEREKASSTDALFEFNRTIIDATMEECACYKVQIAYYEALGIAGLQVYARTLDYLRKKHALVIADVKRGDIADTAAQYARAHFTGDFEADFVTLSPYMGMDSLEPWIYYVEKSGKGLFVLMRTSNKGSRDFQYQELSQGYRLYTLVGDKIRELSTQYEGVHGYAALGVVVGCTEAAEAAQIRNRYQDLFFLIPGYGAQGGAAHDAARLLINGNGGVVNASRSILKAWQNISEEGAPSSGVQGSAGNVAQEGASSFKARKNTEEIIRSATYTDVYEAANKAARAMKQSIKQAVHEAGKSIQA